MSNRRRVLVAAALLNMGIGFCLVAAPDDADGLIELWGHDALVIEKVAPSSS